MKIRFVLFFLSIALGCSSPSPKKGYWQSLDSINPEAIAYQVKGAELYPKYYKYSNQDSITRLYISYLDTALSIDSRYELALSERAKAYLSINERGKAIRDYQTLIHLNEANPYPKIMLASIYLEDGDSIGGVALLNQGLNTLKSTVDMYPDSIALYVEYIATLKKFGRVKEAEALMKGGPKITSKYHKEILERL